MDTSDPEIVFDTDGVCNHCLNFDKEWSLSWFPDEKGKVMLDQAMTDIREKGKGKEFDCIIGLSGGVDSSYLALVLKEYNLRPLVVHVDAGWNSELAVHNIEQIVKFCGYELHTHVMDWEEIRDLQVAYLKAGVANQDVVQDHAFFASLYHFAVKNKISNVVSGGNIATESVFPNAWHHDAMDAISLKDIHKKFGSGKLRTFKPISFYKYYFYYPFIKKMKVIRPLNYLPYDKAEALNELKEKVGYKEYGRKHGESRFTKFFQNHYLPVKFQIDKRRAHFSSMILSRQLTRDEAMEALSEPFYEENELKADKIYVAKKLGIEVEVFETMIESSGNHYSEYKNWDFYYGYSLKLRSLLSKFKFVSEKSY
jgi:N-acetyl sugar amidotransferase